MRRIVLLLASMTAAMVLAMGVGVLNAGKPAEATFPGTNGRIAYANYDGTDYEIYTINPVGGGSRVTNNDKDDSEPSFSPDGKRIAYVASDGNDFEIYTINVGGGDKTQVTNNDTADYGLSWGRRR